jgi:hypothetical protein
MANMTESELKRYIDEQIDASARIQRNVVDHANKNDDDWLLSLITNLLKDFVPGGNTLADLVRRLAIWVKYKYRGRNLPPQPSAPQSNSSVRNVGDKDPCPCGSGRRYENCCGFAS